MNCVICGKEIQGFKILNNEEVLCLNCFVKKYKSEIEQKVNVIVFEKDRIPFDELCHNCGSRMIWQIEVKANARYIYFDCPKCGAKRIHISKV